MGKSFVGFSHSVGIVFFLDGRPLVVDNSRPIRWTRPSSMERPALAREWAMIQRIAIEIRRLGGISIGT